MINATLSKFVKVTGRSRESWMCSQDRAMADSAMDPLFGTNRRAPDRHWELLSATRVPYGRCYPGVESPWLRRTNQQFREEQILARKLFG